MVAHALHRTNGPLHVSRRRPGERLGPTPEAGLGCQGSVARVRHHQGATWNHFSPVYRLGLGIIWVPRLDHINAVI